MACAIGSQVRVHGVDFLSRDGFSGRVVNDSLTGLLFSQVINITLGTGLPALMMCLSGNGKFRIDNETNRSVRRCPYYSL
jgi:hypothetical protein